MLVECSEGDGLLTLHDQPTAEDVRLQYGDIPYEDAAEVAKQIAKAMRSTAGLRMAELAGLSLLHSETFGDEPQLDTTTINLVTT